MNDKPGPLPRMRFEMSAEQHERLLDACRPTPYIIVGGMAPRSPQENANAAWRSLSAEMGFDFRTVRPDPEGTRFFSAVPS